MNIDYRTTGAVISTLVVLGIMFLLGILWGQKNVLDSERLKAQHNAQYQLVSVKDKAPSADLINAAMLVCVDVTGSRRETCINEFLNQYGEIWLVNLVEGTREQLSSEE